MALLDGVEVGRTLAARVWSVAGALIALWLLGVSVTSGSTALALVSALLLAGAGVNLISSFGDRFRFDAEGVSYRNRWSGRSLFASRRVEWHEVEAIRLWRARMLVLIVRNGSRLIIDHVERFEEIHETAVARAGLSPSRPDPPPSLVS